VINSKKKWVRARKLPVSSHFHFWFWLQIGFHMLDTGRNPERAHRSTSLTALSLPKGGTKGVPWLPRSSASDFDAALSRREMRIKE